MFKELVYNEREALFSVNGIQLRQQGSYDIQKKILT